MTRDLSSLVVTVALLCFGFALSAAPKFEVASIRACKDGDMRGGGKHGRAADFSPGTLHVDCATVFDLINQAYVLFADGHVNPRSRVPIEGGPSWIRSRSYRIDAKTEGAQNQGMMHGPMLQTLLEDRFRLKIHRESREVAGYALKAMSGSGLKPFREGSCVPLDVRFLEQFPPPPLPDLPPGQEYCGGVDPKDGTRWVGAIVMTKGPMLVIEARAMSVDEFVKVSLRPQLDRPVVNETGITGLFDFHVEYAPDVAMPDVRETASDPSGPSIFNAVQRQLGLKLEPARARSEFLVIDRVERPSAN